MPCRCLEGAHGMQRRQGAVGHALSLAQGPSRRNRLPAGASRRHVSGLKRQGGSDERHRSHVRHGPLPPRRGQPPRYPPHPYLPPPPPSPSPSPPTLPTRPPCASAPPSPPPPPPP